MRPAVEGDRRTELVVEVNTLSRHKCPKFYAFGAGAGERFLPLADKHGRVTESCRGCFPCRGGEDMYCWSVPCTGEDWISEPPGQAGYLPVDKTRRRELMKSGTTGRKEGSIVLMVGELLYESTHEPGPPQTQKGTVSRWWRQIERSRSAILLDWRIPKGLQAVLEKQMRCVTDLVIAGMSAVVSTESEACKFSTTRSFGPDASEGARTQNTLHTIKYPLRGPPSMNNWHPSVV
jgi:hypothetical protein